MTYRLGKQQQISGTVGIPVGNALAAALLIAFGTELSSNNPRTNNAEDETN